MRNIRLMTVTHENFDAAVATVNAGGRMLILAMGRPVRIEAKHIASWAAIGKRLVYPSRDGKGFYIRRGKTADYILPGLLVVEQGA